MAEKGQRLGAARAARTKDAGHALCDSTASAADGACEAGLLLRLLTGWRRRGRFLERLHRQRPYAVLFEAEALVQANNLVQWREVQQVRAARKPATVAVARRGQERRARRTCGSA